MGAVLQRDDNSMEWGPSWKNDSTSAGQEILRLLCNPIVHYRVHKISHLDPVLSHMNPVHSFTYYFSKFHFNIIKPSIITQIVQSHASFAVIRNEVK
jgi:hypothetical protein